MDKSKTKTKTLKEKKEKKEKGAVEMELEATMESVVSEKVLMKETEIATESDYASPLQTEALARSESESGRFWIPRTPLRAKRRRQDQVSESSTDVEIMGSLSPASVKKKGACRKSDFLKREEGRQTSESELEQLARQAEASRLALGLEKDKPNDERSAGDLREVAKTYLGLVQKVASKSRNLKGTSVRYLRDAAEVIDTIVEVLISRTSSEETAVLQAENIRRQNEIAALKKEMAQLREEIVQAKKVNISSTKPVILRKEQPSTSSQMEEITRTIMVEVGNMVNARLDSLEDRLLPAKRLRPPLAVDRKNAATGFVVDKDPTRKLLEVPLNSESTSTKKQKKSKGESRPSEPHSQSVFSHSDNNTWSNVVEGRSKHTVVEKGTDDVTSSMSLSQVLPTSESQWTKVIRKGSKAQSGAAKGKLNSLRAPAKKLQSPRSAAVVITLQPGAIEKGLTYAKVLSDARKSMDISTCGITSPLRTRKAITGAYVFEVPGTSSSEKADMLAGKLQEVLGEEVAKVTRPVKTAEIRISGLDESVSTDEVTSAIVKRTACPLDSVRIGEIHRTPKGLGSVWIRCPITTAKILQEDGRLLVGWVAARVYVLPSRPLRCYKCLHYGHVRAQCTSEIDRSAECYRCGLHSHKAAECSAEPRCSICAAANKPANHMSGGKLCFPPKPRKSDKTTVVIPNDSAALLNPSQLGSEEVMDIACN